MWNKPCRRSEIISWNSWNNSFNVDFGFCEFWNFNSENNFEELKIYCIILFRLWLIINKLKQLIIYYIKQFFHWEMKNQKKYSKKASFGYNSGNLKMRVI